MGGIRVFVSAKAPIQSDIRNRPALFQLLLNHPKKENDMNRTTSALHRWLAPMGALLLLFAVGCHGGDPVLGGPGDPPVLLTRPQVTLTSPVTTIPGPTTGAPVNAAITAAFTTDMAPASITGTSFMLKGPGTTAVAGAVTYANRTATFTPTAVLAYSTTYTATITTAVTDTGGYALNGNQGTLPAASNYVWTFTTGVAPDLTRPQVTLTVPVTTIPGPTTGVLVNTAITAAFTEDMLAASINGTSFTVTGPGTTAVAGAVTYATRTATFTPTAVLAYSTVYTATITTAATDLAGNQLAGNQGALPAASNYKWTFTTGVAPDTTRPRVTVTLPVTTTPGPTLAVPTNTAITATFTENMAAGTLTIASFNLTGPGITPVTGGVTYANRTAVFTPAAALVVNTTYTATITTAATDLAGNQLAGNQAALPAASNYVWTFTTEAVVTNPPNITLTNPADLAINVPLNAAVNATFSKAMNPLTLTTVTFTVQPSGPPLGTALLGSVTYDAVTHIATFTPSSPLIPNTQYTATVTTAAKDLAGVALAPALLPNPWTFTTSNSGIAPGGVVLGSAGVNGIMATSAITNTGAATMINGNVSLEPGTSNGLLPVQVNGTIHINDTVSHQAGIDLLVAYNFAKNLPPGTTVTAGADIAAVYPLGIPPGTYTSGSTILVSTPLIMDAGGNANAVWVFQIGSSLTTTANISLVNGAQAKNIFWVPTLDATIGVGSTFYGTIVTGRDATAKTGAVINGRILAGATLAGTIALDTNTVNVPAP